MKTLELNGLTLLRFLYGNFKNHFLNSFASGFKLFLNILRRYRDFVCRHVIIPFTSLLFMMWLCGFEVQPNFEFLYLNSYAELLR